MNKTETLKSIIDRFESSDFSGANESMKYIDAYNGIKQQMFYDVYPNMFDSHTFDFSIGLGWFSILENFCKKAELISDSKNFIKILQVKEKFGGIRINCKLSSKNKTLYSAIADLKTDAEKLCEITCETCGVPGTKITDGWRRVRCEKHGI